MTPSGRLVVLLASAGVLVSYCDRVNLSVTAIWMQSEFHWTESQKALVLSAFFYGYIFANFWGAHLLTRVSPKRVLALAGVAWAVLTVTVPMMSEISVYAVIASRVLFGVSQGVIFPVISHLLTKWVAPEERSRAVALVSSGTIAGSLVIFLASPTCVRMYGWRSVFYLSGGLVTPAWVVMWSRGVPEHASHQRREEDTPLKASGSLGGPSGSLGGSSGILGGEATTMGYGDMLRSKTHRAVFLAHFTHNLGHYVFLAWLPTFVHDRLEFKGDALSVVALPWAAAGLLMLVGSWVVDVCWFQRHKSSSSSGVRRFFTVAGFVLTGVLFIATGIVLRVLGSAYPVVAMILLSLALALNGVTPVLGYEAAKLDIAKSSTDSSRLQALSNAFGTLAGILGIPVVVALRGEYGDDWFRVFGVIGSVYLVSALVFFRDARW